MALNSTKVGQVIADLRARRKLSRPDVARRVGVTSNYLGMVEAGKRTLSVMTLKKLAEVFDVPDEFIICLGSNIPTRSDPRRRFADLLRATQSAMLAAIDADEETE
jgi:transcriptional regulator with XRE-family HTH domain